MLTAEENELLVRVGPGTPGGELLRRYWHPVAATVQLDEDPVRPVRILGEDLVLFRDRLGRMGLIAQRCPHRAMDLRFGVPEEEGLRCPYHGWLFDTSGVCLQMPLEPPDSTFRERVATKAYPVKELGGLVWAYLGPDPAPAVARVGPVRSAGRFSVRSSPTGSRATGCRSWRTAATSAMPSTCTVGCSNTRSRSRDGSPMTRGPATTPS